jgi:hypothetical protein
LAVGVGERVEAGVGERVEALDMRLGEAETARRVS